MGIMGILPGTVPVRIIPMFPGIIGNYIPGTFQEMFSGTFLEYSRNISEMFLEQLEQKFHF